jgi:hypothetical protein
MLFDEKQLYRRNVDGRIGEGEQTTSAVRAVYLRVDLSPMRRLN